MNRVVSQKRFLKIMKTVCFPNGNTYGFVLICSYCSITRIVLWSQGVHLFNLLKSWLSVKHKSICVSQQERKQKKDLTTAFVLLYERKTNYNKKKSADENKQRHLESGAFSF